MHINHYAREANKTRIYPPEYAIIYPALKLAGEAGEVAEKVGKVLRDNNGEFTPSIKMDLAHELGDVLWYINAIAEDIGVTLADIAHMNINKLHSRQERGVLGGSGDNR